MLTLRFRALLEDLVLSSASQKLSPHFMEIEDDAAGPYAEASALGPHLRGKFRLRFNIILQSTLRFFQNYR